MPTSARSSGGNDTNEEVSPLQAAKAGGLECCRWAIGARCRWLRGSETTDSWLCRRWRS